MLREVAFVEIPVRVESDASALTECLCVLGDRAPIRCDSVNPACLSAGEQRAVGADRYALGMVQSPGDRSALARHESRQGAPPPGVQASGSRSAIVASPGRARSTAPTRLEITAAVAT